ARPARKYVGFPIPDDGGRVQQKSAAAEKLPAEEHAQEGVERILVPNAIETNFIPKSAQRCALEFIGKVGRSTGGQRTIVQRDLDGRSSGIRERPITRRCRTKKVPIAHLQPEGHPADRQLELLPWIAPCIDERGTQSAP